MNSFRFGQVNQQDLFYAGPDILDLIDHTLPRPRLKISEEFLNHMDVFLSPFMEMPGIFIEKDLRWAS